MKATEPFSSHEIVRLSGVTYRQLDTWARTGLAEPSIAPAKGSGSARRYSRDDLDRVALIKELIDAGISLRFIRENGNDPYRTLEVLARRLEPLALEHRAKMRRVA